MHYSDRLLYLLAQALAIKSYIYIKATVTRDPTNPVYMFRFEFDKETGGDTIEIRCNDGTHIDAMDMALDNLENEINYTYDHQTKVERRRQVANAALAKLNNEEKEALGLIKK